MTVPLTATPVAVAARRKLVELTLEGVRSSLNPAVMLALVGTDVVPAAGLVDDTAGGVVSGGVGRTETFQD